MNFSKVKAFAVVFALLICTCFVATGCKGKASALINTKAMPGNTFKQSINNKHKTNPNIVYLGSSEDNSGVHFGSNGVSLDLISTR